MHTDETNGYRKEISGEQLTDEKQVIDLLAD
jgi:hypothetical protein